jgi:hypothetical protein
LTLYIRQSSQPDIVKRYDNVCEIVADRESQTIYLKQIVWGRHKPYSTERYKHWTHSNLENVISVESN